MYLDDCLSPYLCFAVICGGGVGGGYIVGVVVVVTAVTVTAVLDLIEVLLLICLKSMQFYFLLLLPFDFGYFDD